MKCKHNLTIGSCWLCLGGKASKPPKQSYDALWYINGEHCAHTHFYQCRDRDGSPGRNKLFDKDNEEQINWHEGH